MHIILFSSLLLLQSITSAYPIDDLVSFLPQMPDLSFDMYSGYLPINETDHSLFYIATLSQRDPLTDPVIIWFNGGPGCSSLFGFALENGPYAMDDGTEFFQKNEHSWNQEATMIYIEATAGVGYSLCSNDCEFNDENSADDNLIAIANLFQMKFPELQMNDLYISGESYAGIYIPYLVRRIDEYNNNVDENGNYKLNLKGFMIGNPATNFKYDNIPAFVEMAYQLSFIDHQIYTNVHTYCDILEQQKFLFDNYDEIKPDCQASMIQFYNALGKINRYDLFGKCYQPPTQLSLYSKTSYINDLFLSDAASHLQKHELKQYYTIEDYAKWAMPQKQGGMKKLRFPVQCAYRGPAVNYFNDEVVMKNLHVSNDVEEWNFCKDDIKYNISYNGSQWIYEELKHKDYRILIFSGDTDGVVPTLGTIQWIKDMDWDVTQDWRPYFYKGQVSGYIESRGVLTFATVHGAGHMAAQNKRAETYNLIFKWINKSNP